MEGTVGGGFKDVVARDSVMTLTVSLDRATTGRYS
jgi:hypothetical protein